ncbi:hypothetical protein [Paraburkholderia sp. CNPSo 3281]|uniref:hypothetical protein n=1 Tax=Paraburkholderia sp. CNPSo 3281 TaxID=2940933 RepID=UPI0020B7ED30|nr:hypothetical protein [Paraburkholderia sp. CNPSo 3281]MCP3718511.1 hypothetical protein [Paraburkholderia sp. CNPSo 3281]
MKNGMSRWQRVAVGLILLLGAASAKAEAPAHCAYGYQDSSCLGPQYRAAQTPPTCSTGAGWTTLTPAKWMGSGFTQPQCNYQAPPSCQTGWQEISGPSWNGSAWVGLSCQIPPAPGPNTCQYGFASGPTWNGSSWVYSCNAQPQNPAAICTAAAANGTVISGGVGYTRQAVAGSQFTQYTNFTQTVWGQNTDHYFNWPSYSLDDPFGNIDISNAQAVLGLPQSTLTVDSWYFASYTGPGFGGAAGGTYNTYVAACALNPSGRVDGVQMSQYYPAVYDAN